MPFAQANGQTLYYEDTGGQGPVLVFSHGFLLDTDMFAAQVRALKAGWRCISWDQRGFGRTGPVRDAFTYWDSARDLLALLDHLGIERAVLAGLSQGGFLSLRAAALAPERVRALILLSTQAGLDSPETIGGFYQLKAEWEANGPANVRDFLADKLIGAGADREPWFRKWAAMDKGALSQPIVTLATRDDFTPHLGKITCPSLVIHGEADTAIDLACSQALARGLGDRARGVQIPGAGHAPPLTHAEAVTQAMTDFLSVQIERAR
jgi:pimeloyl-ACP methyl ester carboxylesterase